jgi:hypothetical protein
MVLDFSTPESYAGEGGTSSYLISYLICWYTSSAFPYNPSMAISPLLGCLFMSLQSYSVYTTRSFNRSLNSSFWKFTIYFRTYTIWALFWDSIIWTMLVMLPLLGVYSFFCFIDLK